MSPPRTLKTLKDDLQNYNEDGSVLSRAKLFNNVIRPAILPVLIMDACIPALHLDLGIFPYLYDAMLADARDLDIKLAKLIDNVDDSGTEFRKLVKMSNDLTEREETLRQLEASLTTVRDQISCLSLHMHDTMQCAATGHQVTVPALIGTLRLQEQELLVKKEKVNVDRQGLERERSKLKSVKDGPCSSCYEPESAGSHTMVEPL